MKMKISKIYLLSAALTLLATSSFCQQQVNLSNMLQNKKIKAINRTIDLYGELKDGVEMNAQKSDGLGILEEIEFETGTIEIELLGENNPGKSFIGVAFNIEDNETYEAVYFRPFNFVAEEQARKDHMVQYIYHPEFTWRKLRSERTGEFEDEISQSPNPDKWFKVLLKIDDKSVEVYVNDIAKPVLSVDRLTTTKSSKIGVWTGFGSSGRFRNLTLTEQ